MPNFNYTYFRNLATFNNNSTNNSNFSDEINKETHCFSDKTQPTDTNTSTSPKNNQFDFSHLFRKSGNTISIFGFSIEIDDLIIVGVLIFLVYEKCDDIYLIILLGLLFFDIKLDFWR